MTGNSQSSLAIMFADISGSTQLYEQLGDEPARAIVSKCIELIFDKVETFDGTVIKTIGDEVMCTFPSADQGVAAATAMQDAVTDDLQPEIEDARLTIRVGVHYGPVIHENDDVFGDAVNLAARMAGRAKAEQIITTAETVAALSNVWRASTRHIDTMPVKGKSGEIQVHEVIWQPEEATQLTTRFVRKLPPVPANARLVLSFEGAEVELTQASGKAILGRDPNSTLPVVTPKASRLHLSIECLRGKFVLTDQSTNGTYVKMSSGQMYLRSGENIMLSGSGEISLGQSFDNNSKIVVFRCTS